MNEDEPPRTLIDLLNELVEPPEPPPVAMTPQTWGWAVLATLLAVALAWLAWQAWRRWRANAYRRAALVELAAAGDDPAKVAEILRRTALAAWPRERVASLTGRDWLVFLDATGGIGFVDGPGAALAEAPYRGGEAPAPGLGEVAARWVRRHRVEAAR
jgi:Domain of unknown function (DUF4381)